VLDFGIEASTPYLVSELGVGETLEARIARGNVQHLGYSPPTSAELSRVVGEIAQALDVMHAVGVLHRDLQSSRVNLWRSPSPRGERELVKLSFGISKTMNDTLELVRTMARRAVGPVEPPQYASPEQILASSPLDPRSDLWSLAVIAFEYLTGQHPFVGATIGEQLVQICTGSARVPSELCAAPSGFDAWFARGVRKAAPERWGSGRQMAEALAALPGAR
jgi:serine/threonine-protein kinase